MGVAAILRVPDFMRVACVVWLLGVGGCAYDGAGVDWSGGAVDAGMPPGPDAGSRVDAADVAPDANVPPLPGTVHFAADVMPIFVARGCIECHTGSGPGNDLGGLQLDGGKPKVYSEVTKEKSRNFGVVRVDLAAPSQSLLLTMPLAENPSDAHPVAPFASTSDPDYQKLLAWISQGALDN